MGSAGGSDRALLRWLVVGAVGTVVGTGLHWVNAVGPQWGWLTAVALAVQLPAIVVLVVLIVIARRRRVVSSRPSSAGRRRRSGGRR